MMISYLLIVSSKEKKYYAIHIILIKKKLIILIVLHILKYSNREILVIIIERKRMEGKKEIKINHSLRNPHVGNESVGESTRFRNKIRGGIQNPLLRFNSINLFHVRVSQHTLKLANSTYKFRSFNRIRLFRCVKLAELPTFSTFLCAALAIFGVAARVS